MNTTQPDSGTRVQRKLKRGRNVEDHAAAKKTVVAVPPVDRRSQRGADKRNQFPKRSKKRTRPFETTMDF